jgi:hypothetical protein
MARKLEANHHLVQDYTLYCGVSYEILVLKSPLPQKENKKNVMELFCDVVRGSSAVGDGQRTMTLCRRCSETRSSFR